MSQKKIFLKFLVTILIITVNVLGKRNKEKEDKTKCPIVKAIRNFDLERMLGKWYVVEYYASSEEALAYRCMRAEFTMSAPSPIAPNMLQDITMNFTYSFTDDPLNEQLIGNITWRVPDGSQPAHWIHSEDSYEGVYNTYVLDSDYDSWALLLHCAEKEKEPRYLSSFIMSRDGFLGINVRSYLREKLPQYDIDMDFMFDMNQNDCNAANTENILLPPIVLVNRFKLVAEGRHPMNHQHY